ncbi:MAG: hypothetical protein ACKPGI_11590 [Verrucomicrobiota bacterium]
MSGRDRTGVGVGLDAGLSGGGEAGGCRLEHGVTSGFELLDERLDIAQGKSGAAWDDQMGLPPADDILGVAVPQIGCGEIDHHFLGIRGWGETDPDIPVGGHRSDRFHPAGRTIGCSQMAPEVPDRVELPESALPAGDVGGKTLRVLL